jgi:ribosomal protein L11 methyltransferase
VTGDRPPDRWLVLRILAPADPEVRSLMVECLLEEARGVEEQDDALVIHLPPPEGQSAEDFARALRHSLVEHTGIDTLEIETGWQPHEAWEDCWRQHFRPRRITERIVVSPSWETPEVEPGQCLVTLDPGMAFGTSDHPTTRGCLRMLDRWVEPGIRMADIGSGSGILAITAALLGAGEVLAIELDPWACSAARENVVLNGVEDRVEVRAAPVTSDGLPGEAPFDGIVANIESGILLPLLPALHAALEPGGWLVLSGILRNEAEGVLAAATDAGLHFEEADEEGEWWTGAFTAPL